MFVGLESDKVIYSAGWRDRREANVVLLFSIIYTGKLRNRAVKKFSKVTPLTVTKLRLKLGVLKLSPWILGFPCNNCVTVSISVSKGTKK